MNKEINVYYFFSDEYCEKNPEYREIYRNALDKLEGYYKGNCIYFEKEIVNNKDVYYKIDRSKGTRKKISFPDLFDQMRNRLYKLVNEEWNIKHGYSKQKCTK